MASASSSSGGLRCCYHRDYLSKDLSKGFYARFGDSVAHSSPSKIPPLFGSCCRELGVAFECWRGCHWVGTYENDWSQLSLVVRSWHGPLDCALPEGHPRLSSLVALTEMVAVQWVIPGSGSSESVWRCCLGSSPDAQCQVCGSFRVRWPAGGQVAWPHPP